MGNFAVKIALAWLLVAHFFCYSEEVSQMPSEVEPSTPQEKLFDNEAPLPVNDRILALLSLSEKSPESAQMIFEKLVPISNNFNAAERYLMLMVKANLAIENKTEHWLKSALLLKGKIPSKQLVSPIFNNVHLYLAEHYAKQGLFKFAYDHKRNYLENYGDYRQSLKSERITRLNEKYETDLKIKTNELLAKENDVEMIRLKEIEQQQIVQQRVVLLSFVAVIIFLLLIVKQLKIKAILSRMSQTDALTGLLNRNALFEKGRHLLRDAHDNESSLCVLFIDVDHFKKINDTYGHSVGDFVLNKLSELGQESLRNKDVFGRLGGEEFVIICPETNMEQAKAIAEHFREKMAGYAWQYHEHSFTVTVSIGVASLHHTLPEFDDVLNAADNAMYLAKNSGRNQVCSHINQ